MIMENKNLWWGYKDIGDNIHVKKYLGEMDYEEAMDNPSCNFIVEPFEARNKSEAFEIIKTLINDTIYKR